jgi:hypothetical protein
MYAFILVAARYITCFVDDAEDYCTSGHLFIIFLIVESILFGLFTLCMIGDQWTTISMNQTQIDRLKNKKYEYQNEYNEVCGTPSHINFQLSWLFPIPVRFAEEIRQKVYGFIHDEIEGAERLLNPLHQKNSNKEEGMGSGNHPQEEEEISPLIHDKSGHLSNNSSDPNLRRSGRKPSPRRVSSLLIILITV